MATPDVTSKSRLVFRLSAELGDLVVYVEVARACAVGTLVSAVGRAEGNFPGSGEAGGVMGTR